ncbi:MAG: metallophosphoesterase family protein [Rhodospirillaceae bacterium]
MAQLSILHLSDLHFVGSKSPDQRIVLDALLADLGAEYSEGRIRPDLIVFSGDLVQAGANAELFAEVQREFLDPLATIFHLSLTQIVICAGNHDISKAIVDSEDYVEDGLFGKLNDTTEVNKFIDAHFEADTSKLAALKRLENFQSFISVFDTPKNDLLVLLSPFLRVYKYQIEGLRVGIASLNSSWRATGRGEEEYGKLIIGERTVDKAIECLADSEFRIAVFHHPTECLREFDQLAISARISKHFDLGHILIKGIPKYRER